MYTVTNSKKLAGLVLAVSMVASLFSVSAAANTQIFINDELAVSGTEYTETVNVTVEGEDVTKVTVNDLKVNLNSDNTFEIVPVEELSSVPEVPAEPEMVETTDTPDAATPDTADTNTTDVTSESSSVEVLYGEVSIAVFNSVGEPTSFVAVKFVKEAAPIDPAPVTTPDPEPIATPDPEPIATPDPTPNPEPVNPDPVDPTPVATPDVTTPDKATPDVATPDKATSDTATVDVATPDKATPDKATPDDPIAPAPYMTGDLDNNGVITSADALMALRASVGLVELDEAQTKAADVDNNGVIASADALRILRVAVELDKFE